MPKVLFVYKFLTTKRNSTKFAYRVIENFENVFAENIRKSIGVVTVNVISERGHLFLDKKIIKVGNLLLDGVYVFYSSSILKHTAF